MCDFRKMVADDLETVFSDGFDTIFTNTETLETITLKTLAARVSQHYNPLTGMSEPLPIHTITVSKKAFTISIPTDLSMLKVEWTGLAGETVNACVKEERATNSMGMITFLCQMDI